VGYNKSISQQRCSNPSRRKERGVLRVPLHVASTGTIVRKGEKHNQAKARVSAANKAYHAERDNASFSGRHHRHGSQVDNLDRADKSNIS
jgi:hypothetical protein